MKESFKTALVYCAAIASFTGGAYIGLSGLNSIIADRVAAVTVSNAAPAEVPDVTGDAVVAGVKKALKALLVK